MLISRLTESAMMVEFGQQITAETTAMIADYVTFIKTQYSRELIDVTPSYTKVMLHFRLDCNCYSLLVAASEQWFADHQQSHKGSCHSTSKLHQLPVYYHSDVAPDLATVAEHSKLTEQQVIYRHSDKIYQVGAIGFTAGFAFLSTVDDEIAMPRLLSPRLQIPAGSVGIADNQTAIYPDQSPGGWHIIGNCPQSLFLADQYPLSIFAIGERVQFFAITKQEFLDLGGQLWKR